MPAFGSANVGWIDSFVLEVGAERFSQNFRVPSGFSGHVYIHGVGGNQQAIFAVGSDGNGQFTPNGGFLVKEQHNEMPDVMIEQVAALTWRIAKLPASGAPHTSIMVSVVGVRLGV